MTTAARVRDAYLTVNGVELHYRERGSADAPPLFIFHGLTGHAWEFDPLAEALAEEYHVFSVNQRGHGASEWADDYSQSTMAEDIAEVIRKLAGGPARVIGHSMGAVNSWTSAARHPELFERLVTLDIGPEVIVSKEIRDGFVGALDVAASATFSDPEEAVANYLPEYIENSSEEQRTFVLNNIRQQSDGSWTWRFDALGLKGWFDVSPEAAERHWAALRSLRMPVLVIQGAESVFWDEAMFNRTAEAISGSQRVRIENAGHDVHMDQLDELVAVLRAFLREV